MPKTLTLKERARLAFALHGQAENHVEHLTAAELTAFADLVDEAGVPQHVRQDGVLVPHTAIHQFENLVETCSMRFAELWRAFRARLQQPAAEPTDPPPES